MLEMCEKAILSSSFTISGRTVYKLVGLPFLIPSTPPPRVQISGKPMSLDNTTQPSQRVLETEVFVPKEQEATIARALGVGILSVSLALTLRI